MGITKFLWAIVIKKAAFFLTEWGRSEWISNQACGLEIRGLKGGEKKRFHSHFVWEIFLSIERLNV